MMKTHKANRAISSNVKILIKSNLVEKTANMKVFNIKWHNAANMKTIHASTMCTQLPVNEMHNPSILY